MTMGSARMWRSALLLGVVTVAGSLLPTVTAGATTQTFPGTVDAAGVSWRAHTFDVTQAGTINASLDWDEPKANLNLFLYDPSGQLVASAASATAKPETLTWPTTTTGLWKLGVKAKTGAAAYMLSVDYPGPAAVLIPAYVRTIGGPGHAEMYPSGVDVDASGNVYVADTGDDEIQAYAPTGAWLWTVGGAQGAGLGKFINPRDVAYLNGKVYVADTGNARVQVLDAATGAPLSIWSASVGTIMGVSAGVDGAGSPIVLVSQSLPVSTVKVFTPAGVLVRSVGTGPGAGDGMLNEERDAATDSLGNIYVADYRNQRVAKFDPTGAWLGSWGTRGTGPGQFRLPYGVDVDIQDRVYVADANNDRIQEFSSGGTFLGIFGTSGTGSGQFQMLRRVAVGAGASPDVYAADLWQFKIERFAQDGTYEMTLGGVSPPDGLFNEAYGMDADAVSTFVIDTTNQRAQRFSSTSPYAYELAWGARGWGEGNPGFNWARDIAIDAADNTVWVADTKNSRLTEFTRGGSATGRTFGGYGSAIGQLNYPYAVDSYGGDLIVADSKNNRIQRWNPAGPSVVWTATGFNFPRDVYVFGDVVYVADTRNHRVVRLAVGDGSVIGSFGTSQLHNPEGVAVEPSGDVWVADTDWNRLVEFASDGTYLQRFGSGGGAHGQFSWPAHLEIVGTQTTVYLLVADVENDRIEVFRVA
jgi:DNA-binding beta-propeller fold protein YncE